MPGPAAGGRCPPDVDPWLLQNVLTKQRNFAMLARLEAQLDAFVRSSDMTELEAVPPGKSPFQRKVVNLVAVRYNLDNKLGPNSSLILIKTSSSRVPPRRLSAFNSAEYSAAAQSTVTQSGGDKDENNVQLIRRASPLPEESKAGSRASGGSNHSLTAPSAIRNVTEEEYAAARARIFCDGAVPEEGRPALTTGGQVRIAAGPVEGSRGFSRGRGMSRNGSRQGSQPGLGPNFLSADGGAFERGATMPHGLESVDAEPTRRPGPGFANSTDMYDPDFDRSYQRWMAPMPAAPTPPVHPFAVPWMHGMEVPGYGYRPDGHGMHSVDPHLAGAHAMPPMMAAGGQRFPAPAHSLNQTPRSFEGPHLQSLVRESSDGRRVLEANPPEGVTTNLDDMAAFPPLAASTGAGHRPAAPAAWAHGKS